VGAEESGSGVLAVVLGTMLPEPFVGADSLSFRWVQSDWSLGKFVSGGVLGCVKEPGVRSSEEAELSAGGICALTAA